MSRDFPALVDLWSLVRSRRGFEGTWPLGRMTRLKESLHSDDGEARFRMDFGQDSIGVDFVEIELQAALSLICQRTLEPFIYPVDRTVRLGLLRGEGDEAALPEGYEPLLVPDEPVRLTDLVEDELIMALPLVAMSDSGMIQPSGETDEGLDDENTEPQSNPFAALSALRAKGSAEDN